MLRNDIDLRESYLGDLIVKNGDLDDTSENTPMTYYQIIRLIMNMKKRECFIYPDLGINLDQFIGEIITPQKAYQAATLIRESIAESTALYASEIEVTPFPIGRYAVAFKINLNTVAPNATDLVIAYDSKDNMVQALNFPEIN